MIEQRLGGAKMSHMASDLQTRFPLAVRRKFWKKFLGNLIFSIFLAALGGALLFFAAISETPDAQVLNTFGYAIIGIAVFYLCVMYWYHATYIRRYYYSADADFLTIKKGVFAPTEIHVQYQKIQDVYVDQDFFDLLFGIYDVHVASATATSSMEAHVDGLLAEHAEALKVVLMDAMRNRSGGGAALATPGGSPSQATVRNPAAVSALASVTLERFPLTKEWYVGEVIKTLLITAFTIPLWYVMIFFYTTDDGSSLSTLASSETQVMFVWIFLGCSGLYALWNFIKLILWVGHYRYAFESDFIMQRVGIITVEEKHMPYSTVQNVLVKQGVIDRVLGIADVQIENAATTVVGSYKGRVATAPSSVTIEGLFLKEAETLATQLRTALFGTPSSPTGL